MAAIDEANRRLNHVELVYRPGERPLATKIFELFGFKVRDRGGPWVFAYIDPATSDMSNNAFYASEMTAEQWALEQALTAAVAPADGADTPLAAAARGYVDKLKRDPQFSMHFGIRYRERADFDAALDRIRAADDDPELRGRIGLSAVFMPDAPGAMATNMIQAFVHNDVIASGLLAFDQHIELQWHLPG